MNTALRELIALSLLLGLSLHLCPEGGVRQVLTVLCAALLCLSVLRSFREFDYDLFALETAKLTFYLSNLLFLQLLKFPKFPE